MTTLTIESSIAELAELRRRLDVEGHSQTLAASVRELVESLPPDAPEVCRAFGAEVLKRIAAAAARPRLSQAFAAPKLPLRAPAVSVPGHVTPLPETHYGLVHGGIVQARGFRLVVKAYRFFEFKRELLFSSPVLEIDRSARHIEVVAGVCDRFNDSGSLVSTWSTAERLGSFYASTSVVLPASPCVQIPGGWQGFFRPATMTAGDAIPDSTFYNGTVRWQGQTAGKITVNAYRQPPPPALSIENALFTAMHHRSELSAMPKSNPSFVIDTPYVSVFSLGADSPAVIVTLPRAFRDATMDSKGTVISFERKAGWEVRLFSA